MFNIVRNLSTHSGKLERWIGKEHLESVSRAMKDWYAGDIAMAGVPGGVYARKGGDFVGRIDAGLFAGLSDVAERWAKRQRRSFNAGFSDLADLQTEARQKSRVLNFTKSVTNSVSRFNDNWGTATLPAAGASGGAAPGGTAWVSTSTGAMGFPNPSSGDTQFFVGGELGVGAATSTCCTLLYDRIFSVAKTMNSTGTETVSGVPTRYQSITSTDADYAGGNFLFPTALSTIANTAHNWTVCTYTDQGGNASTLPSFAGVAATPSNFLDTVTPSWFAPLETGDVGIKALTQMQCDATVATGTIDFTIGHPIAWLPTAGSQVQQVINAINGSFQMTRIFDDAALALLSQPTGSNSTIYGQFQTVSG